MLVSMKFCLWKFSSVRRQCNGSNWKVPSVQGAGNHVTRHDEGVSGNYTLPPQELPSVVGSSSREDFGDPDGLFAAKIMYAESIQLCIDQMTVDHWKEYTNRKVKRAYKGKFI